MEFFLLIISWALWCFLHSFFAATKTTAWARSRLGTAFAFYRIIYNVFSFVTILPLLYWQHQIPGPAVIELSPFLMIFKYAAMILSATVVAGSFFSFDTGEFLGIRQIASKNRKPSTHAVISKNGFYGVVRHPMYLGGCIFFCALMMNAPPAQFAGYGILAIYMIIGTTREDRRLARELGDVYREYQKEVPMLFPRVSWRRH